MGNPEHIGDDLIAFFPQGARFAVSREKIQQRPKADYERLLATLSEDEDAYAGYYMEWLWSELFLGHQEPCSLPARHAPVSHAHAMSKLIENFPSSVARHLSSGGVSGSWHFWRHIWRSLWRYFWWCFWKYHCWNI